jgi:hypothetical protein
MSTGLADCADERRAGAERRAAEEIRTAASRSQCFAYTDGEILSIRRKC